MRIRNKLSVQVLFYRKPQEVVEFLRHLRAENYSSKLPRSFFQPPRVRMPYGTLEQIRERVGAHPKRSFCII